MAQSPRELLGRKPLIFSLNIGQIAGFDPDAWGRFADFAVEFGATHLEVARFPFRYGSWFLPDNSDPYAAWSNHCLNILRICPPPEIQEWVKLDEARRLQDILREEMELAGRRGLKGVLAGVEPMWLPEGVYRAHPRWRGAQAELGRIARRPYFAPSIDEPAVLDLYRRAMREFSTLFPGVDQVSFMSNDSGGGIAWTPNTYPGMNGPARWRRRDPGERIAGFLKALQDGSADAGVAMRVHLHSSGLPSSLAASTRAKLRPGLFLNWSNDLPGEAWGAGGAGLGGGVWSTSYPAVGIEDPMGFVAGLPSVYSPSDNTGRAAISIDPANLPLARTLLESYLQEPGSGIERRARTLHRAATRIAGSPDAAEGLIAAWERVASAVHAVAQIRQKGFGLVLSFCCTSMRWLTRPLVPEPENLTPEETRHYLPFLFSNQEPEQATHFGFVLGKGVFRGEGVMWMARWALEEAMATLRGASDSVSGLASKSKDPAAASFLKLYAARVRALACLAATAKHVICYQYALDVSSQPQFGWNTMDYDENILYDSRALQLRKIAREEVDNIAELLELIESQSEPVIHAAGLPEEESVFLLGPRLRDDLRRKMDIMLDHWQDYERLFPSTKVWELEPPLRGNIVEPKAPPERGEGPAAPSA